MLFGETVAVYCKNHTEHTNTLCGQNAEFLCVKVDGTYSDQWALKCWATAAGIQPFRAGGIDGNTVTREPHRMTLISV
jgi:hypothetical protein